MSSCTSGFVSSCAHLKYKKVCERWRTTSSVPRCVEESVCLCVCVCVCVCVHTHVKNRQKRGKTTYAYFFAWPPYYTQSLLSWNSHTHTHTHLHTHTHTHKHKHTQMQHRPPSSPPPNRKALEQLIFISMKMSIFMEIHHKYYCFKNNCLFWYRKI